jgi:CP family cyanate transporter-like MFS transporter
MPPSTPSSLWRGRLLALAGIVLIAANLRTAVAALSPIFAEIGTDVPITSVGIGVLGMLPPICFAVFGIVTPLFTRRASLETVVTISLVVMLAGHLVRALASSFAILTLGTVLTLGAMAVGNVLLPPLVKRYFPDRIGFITSLYATVVSISTFLPPLVSVPAADSFGWRTSVGMWGVLVVIALVPWLGILFARRPAAGGADAVEEPSSVASRRLWRSPIAWALTVVFATSSLNAYASFAWLPELLHDVAGTDSATGGALLSLFAAMGLPAAIFVPVLASRMRDIGRLVYAGVACFLIGYLGLIFVPSVATWLWVSFAGLGPLLFPLCLVLINMRTRTHEGAVALSGFVQGLGYTLGAMGPLLVGVLHQLTGGWLWPLLFLIATAFAAAFAGAVLARPTVLEDTLR